ncbi:MULTISPECIES: IS110 family transposase [Streptomyces]|uniref:IS110 family transposase n=3 Tax=Streptomyces TaxID=1883 RepID=A0A3R7EIA8_9ACTN|nr:MULTISPECIES: IS110 family transposase [Streptomyces]KNE78633.1 transposase [Streptomyces fradiae]OFA33913.1 transposase [Streptomyces fradiae]PQM19337.1 IS110 family transposase [Streptomyces xinghaiensis]RKM89804.1 IS110 family transposase [Streptomyces xinghaiensis]RNC67927.1 IS110 family transposase [Streptomyces xinghaiensis]
MTAAAAEAIADQKVFGGVDSHAETLHVAVISDNGGHLADAEFATTTAGYAASLAFLAAHGHVLAIGIEGTASYGAGLTRVARSHGYRVVEVNRPDRAERRRIGKSDPIDAYAAARAALSGRASAAPKDDTVAGIRALHNAARSAIKARTAALNQISHLLIAAPGTIRAAYGQLKGADRTDALARLRPTGDAVHIAVLTALKSLARRVKELTTEHDALTKALDTHVTQHNPGLRAAYGVGPDTAAQLLVTAGGNPERMRTEASFAALCGAAPVPASSGKTSRHRLSRGGDRAANAALYRIALVRMSSDTRTREYVARQTTAGRTKKEIIRLLKRAITREIFRCLTTTVTVPAIADLRPRRQAMNITLTAAAQHFGVWPTTISRLERGLSRDDSLARAYRDWLHTA